jgi:hypothetical protein
LGLPKHLQCCISRKDELSHYGTQHIKQHSPPACVQEPGANFASSIAWTELKHEKSGARGRYEPGNGLRQLCLNEKFTRLGIRKPESETVPSTADV